MDGVAVHRVPFLVPAAGEPEEVVARVGGHVEQLHEVAGSLETGAVLADVLSSDCAGLGFLQLNRGPAEQPGEDEAEDEKEKGDGGQDHLPEAETPGSEGDGVAHDGALVVGLELIRHDSGLDHVRGRDDC